MREILKRDFLWDINKKGVALFRTHIAVLSKATLMFSSYLLCAYI